MFPEETHYEVDGSTLIEVIFRHTGGNKFEPVYGDNWNIENISEDVINEIMKVALAAPCSFGHRPVEFVVVRNEEIIRKLAACKSIDGDKQTEDE